MAEYRTCEVCGLPLSDYYDYSRWCIGCALELCDQPEADGHAVALAEYYERIEDYERDGPAVEKPLGS